MAADNQNRLASFTAWKRGRCKLALHWAKRKKYSWFRPKTGPGSCSHSAYVPPPPLSWPQLCGQNSSEKQQVFFWELSAVTYRRNLGPTAHLQRQRLLLLLLSHSRRLFLFSPHTQNFVCLFVFLRLNHH